jgi:hypothetical protein
VSDRIPKIIFLPDKTLIREMIHANLKFAKKDKLHIFLLRYGVVEDEKWHIE